MYVSTNRLRVRMTGGRWGNGGTANSATGTVSIVHGVGTVRTCAANLEQSGPATTDQGSRYCQVRVSGTVLVVKVVSHGNTVDSVTTAGYWMATA